MVVTHVHVTVDADASDAEKRRYTGGDADATESYTHTRLAVVEVGTLHHTYRTRSFCALVSSVGLLHQTLSILVSDQSILFYHTILYLQHSRDSCI